MSNGTDYYSTLGVDRSASQDDIKRSYRKLAMQLHPDKHHGDQKMEERFRNVNNAYEVLSDPEKRKMYDQYGDQWERVQSAGGAGAYGFGDSFGDVGSDFFSSLFGDSGFFSWNGSSGRSRSAQKGEDLLTSLTVKLEDIYNGSSKRIYINHYVSCTRCNGSGDTSGVTKQCSRCSGTGKETRRSGMMVVASVCSLCNGTGRAVGSGCGTCSGIGLMEKKEHIKIDIPAGLKEGQRLKSKGNGNAGRYGGPSGDLYIEVQIEPHEIFRRKGADLLVDVTLSLEEAILGCTKQLPSFSGIHTLLVEPGTDSGASIKIRGAGLPVFRMSRRGDIIATVIVEMPKLLSQQQKDSLRSCKFNEKNYPKTTSFWGRLQGILWGAS